MGYRTVSQGALCVGFCPAVFLSLMLLKLCILAHPGFVFKPPIIIKTEVTRTQAAALALRTRTLLGTNAQEPSTPILHLCLPRREADLCRLLAILSG